MAENGNNAALDDQIALLRRQIFELTEQAAAASGIAREEQLADILKEKQDRLNDLLRERSQPS